MMNESSAMKAQTLLFKSRWLPGLGLILVLAIVLGIGFASRKGGIIELLVQSNPIELAEQSIIQGSEKQRYDGLMLIKKEGLAVDLEILKKVFFADNSFRVRKLVLEILMRRIELPVAKKFLQQILPLESDPKISQIINYKLQKVSDDMRWLYKM